MEEINFGGRIIRQIEASSNKCVVCGGSARYSYYGAIVCQSCKVFFRRNAQNRSVCLKLKNIFF
jgi:hypothetical protein